MVFLHLSDLHLGKRVNEFSLLEDQAHILTQIEDIAARRKADAVVIAGDLYDRAAPPAEAVQLLDGFLTHLAQAGRAVLVCAGNHDSPERLAFGGALLAKSRLYVSPAYNGEVRAVELRDEWGPVRFYLLPFLKPATVRRAFPDEEIDGYEAAVRTALAHVSPAPQGRCVLAAHQFVTGAAPGGSEELNVGGLDNVSAAAFDAFDYVALGHIHSPQHIGRDTLRYCGSPLKYSLAEARGQKSVTVVTMAEKGAVRVETEPLAPLRDLREIRGAYDEVTARSFYEHSNTQDYLHITLTDEEEILDAVGKLRSIYPNLLRLDYDNARTRAGAALPGPAAVQSKTPAELFGEFYEKQNGRPLSDEQRAYLDGLIETVWEEGRA